MFPPLVLCSRSSAEGAFFVGGFDDAAAAEAAELVFFEGLIALRFFGACHDAEV